MRTLIISLLAACGADPSTPDDTDATTDTDTPTSADDTDEAAPPDTDADDTDVDDTDVDDTEVPVTPHDCLDDHGIFGLSSRWTYAWKNGSRTGNRVVTITTYDNDRNTATKRVASNWTDAAATFSEVRVVTLHCDADHLYMDAETIDSTLDLSLADPTVVADRVTYSEPVRLQANETLSPPSPTMWTRRVRGTRVDAEGAQTDLDSEVMCWLVQADVAGYSPWTPDHFQCGAPPVFPDPEPTVTEEWRWERGVGVVNDWDTRLTEHVP